MMGGWSCGWSGRPIPGLRSFSLRPRWRPIFFLDKLATGITQSFLVQKLRALKQGPRKDSKKVSMTFNYNLRNVNKAEKANNQLPPVWRFCARCSFGEMLLWRDAPGGMPLWRDALARCSGQWQLAPVSKSGGIDFPFLEV